MPAARSAISVRVYRGSELSEYETAFLGFKPNLKRKTFSGIFSMLLALVVMAAKGYYPSRVLDKFRKLGTKQNMYFQSEKLLS